MTGEHDWRYYDFSSDESPADAALMLVASETGTSVAELEPLTKTIDVEAVNQLFAGDPDDDRRLEFTYDDYAVRITPDWVGIAPQ